MLEIMKKFDAQISRAAILAIYKQAIEDLSAHWPLSKKFIREQEIALTILNQPILTHLDRMTLLGIYQTSYHDSGKIQGITSCDGSAHGCKFCNDMRELAEKFPELGIICDLCYDHQQEIDRSNVGPRHALNGLIMKTVEFEEDEVAGLPITSILREDSSGEIDNMIQALNYLKIAKSHPYSEAACWTKNAPVVSVAVDYYGKPENLRLIQSSPRIGVPVTLAPHFDNSFTVYRNKAETLAAIARGANPCNGQHCIDCGYRCYYSEKKGGWKPGTDIAETLRLKNRKKEVAR